MVIAATAMAICVGSANARAPKTEEVDVDPLEMEFDANVDTPKVPTKLRETVLNNVRSNVSHLRKHNLNVSTTRSGEVLVITIPCDVLFAPNSTQLLASATEILKPLAAYMRQPQLYKILIAVSSDNTGSEEYANSLTEERAGAIDGFVASLAGDTAPLIVPYGLGMDDPVTNNNTRENRRKNRRVEIYLVPDTPLFQKIK